MDVLLGASIGLFSQNRSGLNTVFLHALRAVGDGERCGVETIDRAFVVVRRDQNARPESGCGEDVNVVQVPEFVLRIDQIQQIVPHLLCILGLLLGRPYLDERQRTAILLVVAEDQIAFVESRLHAQVVVVEADALAVVDPQAQHITAGLFEGIVERGRTGNEGRIDHSGEVAVGTAVGPLVSDLVIVAALDTQAVQRQLLGCLGINGLFQTADRNRRQFAVLLFFKSVAGDQYDAAADGHEIFQ